MFAAILNFTKNKGPSLQTQIVAKRLVPSVPNLLVVTEAHYPERHTGCTLESILSGIFLFLELRYVGCSLISRETTLTFAQRHEKEKKKKKKTGLTQRITMED